MNFYGFFFLLKEQIFEQKLNLKLEHEIILLFLQI